MNNKKRKLEEKEKQPRRKIHDTDVDFGSFPLNDLLVFTCFSGFSLFQILTNDKQSKHLLNKQKNE